MADHNISTRFGHGCSFVGVEHVRCCEHVFGMGQCHEIDFLGIGHACLFQIGAERAVDKADCREILDAREPHGFQIIKEFIEHAEGIRSIDARQHWRALGHGQDFFRHVHDDVVGIAISEKPCERSASGHAVTTRIVNDDKVNTALFFTLGGKTRTCATTDDGHAAAFHVLEFFHQVFSFKTRHSGSPCNLGRDAGEGRQGGFHKHRVIDVGFHAGNRAAAGGSDGFFDGLK